VSALKEFLKSVVHIGEVVSKKVVLISAPCMPDTVLLKDKELA